MSLKVSVLRCLSGKDGQTILEINWVDRRFHGTALRARLGELISLRQLTGWRLVMDRNGTHFKLQMTSRDCL